jgi:hypothetical protein
LLAFSLFFVPKRKLRRYAIEAFFFSSSPVN